ERVSERAESARRVEAADAERRPSPSPDHQLAGGVADRRDLVERNGDAAKGVSGEQHVKPPQLELAGVLRPVAFVPPDRVTALRHVETLTRGSPCHIRSPSQHFCGKARMATPMLASTLRSVKAIALFATLGVALALPTA